MADLKQRIRAHADGDTVRRLEVPEWGEPAELAKDGKVKTPAKPLVVTYTMVTLNDLALITKLDGEEWNKRSARIVALKAMDEAGKKLFTLGDATELREVAAPEVVNRIALAMLGRFSLEDAEKNS